MFHLSYKKGYIIVNFYIPTHKISNHFQKVFLNMSLI